MEASEFESESRSILPNLFSHCYQSRYAMTSPLPRGSGFDPGAVHVGFVADIVAPVQVSLSVLRLSPVSITVPMLHIYLHIDTTFIRRTRGRRVETFRQSRALSDMGRALDRTVL
jgi:hypothetical protein